MQLQENKLEVSNISYCNGFCSVSETHHQVSQPKSQHGSFGQKNSEMTSKAFKGHQARHGNSQNQLQCLSQTQVESQDQNSSKAETRYGQSQTKHDNKHGITKTHITVTVVEAQITQTYEDPSPYGTTTTCFGSHAMKNGDLNNKDMNLFRRIKNRISRYNSEGNGSSSESDSDDEKCPKSKAGEKKCPKSKAGDEKCPKSKN